MWRSHMAYAIPETVQSGTYRTLIGGIDQAITNLSRIQNTLAVAPSSALPSGFQDEDEIIDLSKNFEGVKNALDGLIAFSKLQSTMRVDTDKLKV